MHGHTTWLCCTAYTAQHYSVKALQHSSSCYLNTEAYISHQTIIQDTMIGCTCFCFFPGFLLCCHWPLLSTILWTCHTSTTLKQYDIFYIDSFKPAWKYQGNCDKDAPILVWNIEMIPGIRIRVSVSICRTLKSSTKNHVIQMLYCAAVRLA